jgi:4'-phosphopantetheinyl transferase
MVSQYYDYIKANLKEIYIEKYTLSLYILNIEELDSINIDAKKVMPANRYEKMIKYNNEKDRARHLGNELLFYYGMKKILGIDLDTENNELRISRITDRNGKPRLSGIDNIFFNMSHSGEYSTCAFSDCELGIDIEEIKEAHMDIAKRFFSNDEYNELLLLKGKNRDKKFYDYWVMKESFVKATGLGLKIPLNNFSFKPTPNSSSGMVIQHLNSQKYHSVLLDDVIKNYALAVCVKERH